jgi:hypothetical protein
MLRIVSQAIAPDNPEAAYRRAGGGGPHGARASGRRDGVGGRVVRGAGAGDPDGGD